jgi:hypothetical protein
MLQINVVPDKSAVVVVHPTPGVGDATTIADALRMIPNGGDVHVRDGTYAISAGLTVPLNTKIVGAGRNKTIFNMTGAFTLFTTTGGYFCLSEVTVQGDNTSAQIVLNTNHDVDIACSDFNQIKGVVTAVSSAAEVSMTDCYILLSALAGTGIYLWKGATDGVLRWDYVHMTVPITSATLVEGPTVGSAGCRWKVVQSYTGGPPPPVANFYYLQSVDWVNFKIDFAKVSILSDTNKIVGCDFQSCWIRLSPPFASKTLISGCNFELGGDDVGLWVAQLIIGSATSEIVVSGCQFRGNGVSFTGVYVYNSSDIAIDGCTFIAHTTAGVYLEASVPASSAVVTGCRFSEPTPVFENGPDCVGIYASNDGFSGSVLVGLRSTVDAENYRNVRTWGAKGDGTTDDVTAIQAAIAALPSGGGTLFFPPGTYKISSTLTMPDKPVKVMGCGDASVIDVASGSFAAFTVSALSVQREYAIVDLKILGGAATTNNVVSVGDPNSRGVVRLERVNAYEVKYPIKVTTGSGSAPVLVSASDCYFQQLADNSSILIVNSPSFPAVNLTMHKVRFYRDFTDSVVGSLAQGGFYSSFTDVNIIAEDSTFAHGGVDCTIGALNLRNCFIYNYFGVGTRICVADDIFASVTSAVVGCQFDNVDFDLSGNGTSFESCGINSCSFKDGALSRFSNCIFDSTVGTTPADANITGLGDTFVTSCDFGGNTVAAYRLKNVKHVTGCTFGGAATAVILLTNTRATIEGNTFGSTTTVPIVEATTGFNVIVGNRFEKEPSLLATTRMLANKFDTITTVGPVFVQTADVTVANTVTETSLAGSGIGTKTIPANFLAVGRQIRVRARGYVSTTGTPNFRVRIKLGATVILDTGSVAFIGTIANNEWVIEGVITCRSVGGGGTVMAQGSFHEEPDNRAGLTNLATVAVATTVSQLVDVTWEWGTASASNTITCTNLDLEAA